MSKFNKSHLRAIIKESIKEIVRESNSNCNQWQTAHPSFYKSFTNDCCGPTGCDTTNDPCYGLAASSYEHINDPCECGSSGIGGRMEMGQLNEQSQSDCQQINALQVGNKTFAGCCEMGYFGQPPGTPTWNNPFNINSPECKAIQNSAMAINSNFYNCCDPNFGIGDDPCTEELWVAMPLAAPGKTTYCARCKETGGGVATAGNYPVDLVNGAPYYNNNINGTNYCPCCEDEGRSTGGKCDPTDGTYYGFNNGEPRGDHNERWGRDCWFCKEDNMPGCTQIDTPMLQGEAFAAYLAGTSGIHGTDTGCNAVEKCGDGGTGSGLKCTCCGPSGLPISPIPNPNYKSCSSHNGQNGFYGCADVATFDPKACKKPSPTGGGIPTNPRQMNESILRMQKLANILKK